LVEVLRAYQTEASQTTPFWDFLYNRYRQDLEEAGTLVDEASREVLDIVASRVFGVPLLQREKGTGESTALS
jgi:hypothetical protein